MKNPPPGPVPTPPVRRRAPSPRPSYSCREFIADVVAAARRARQERSLRGRRRALATALIQRYVPPIHLLGLDIRRLIVTPLRAGPEEVTVPRRVPGFRRALTAGGQGGEALRHLAAAAATVLVRKGYLRFAANTLDHVQGVTRSNRAEARAEVAGNRAGAALGRLLLAFLDDTLTPVALSRKMQALLGPARAHPRRRRRGPRHPA